MFNFKNLLKCCLGVLIIALYVAPEAKAQDCWGAPSTVVEGDFENCVFTANPCGTLQNLSSGGWNVCPGSPGPAGGSQGTAQGMLLICDSGDNTEGAYTCVRLRPNNQYTLKFDLATLAPYNPGEIHIEATTGLSPTSRAPSQCQDPLPTPTTRFPITVQTATLSSYQSFTVCFTTDDNYYDQLWIYAGYVSGVQSVVTIDNIELIDENFDLLIENSSEPSVVICDGEESDEITLQILEYSNDCEESDYTVTIYENMSYIDSKLLDATEVDDLRHGRLDIKQLYYNSGPIYFEVGKCYLVQVNKSSGCGCDFSRANGVCIESCGCDFSGIIDFSPAIGEFGEWYLSIFSSFQTDTKFYDARWDFGDGSTGNGLYVTHKFPDGTFTVCATIKAVDERTGECCEETICQEITQIYWDFFKNPDGSNGEASSSYNAGGSVNHFESAALQLHPNPSAGSAILDYEVRTQDDHVQIDLYDAQGRLLQSLLDERGRTFGMHHLDIDTAALPNGIYYVKMNRGNDIVATRLIVNR